MTPIWGVAGSIRPARTEKIAIAAARHGEAGARQADDRVAEGRGLPRFGGETARAEERFGDGAVAGAGQPSVERAQGRRSSGRCDEAGLAVFVVAHARCTAKSATPRRRAAAR